MVEPRATYRLQFHRGFAFDDAARLAGYLAELGISHVYCSPLLQASPGSAHGYDVVDHSRVNSELGGADGYARMCAALRAHRLGQVLDIVPNHMAIVSPYNPWWWDVLENGPASNYAAYFDVDWDTPEMRLRNAVLLPVLGDQYGEVLESGEIQVARDGAQMVVKYHEHRFPVAPRSLDTVLAAAAERCGSDELAFLADSFGRLPLPTATDFESTRRRHRDKDVLRAQLARLIREHEGAALAIDQAIADINRDPGALHALLERQNYRLAYWRAASRDLGYRRFFDINTLVGLRMEDERVFRDTHALVLRWLAGGVIDGVRIDHIDGLRDPQDYLARLRKARADAWIIVEKILEPGEQLRETWPVHGTTGYDFMNLLGGVMIDPAGEAPLTRLYNDLLGARADFNRIALEQKDLVMREVLGSDLNRLTALFLEVCEQHPRRRDYTRHDVHEALCAFVAHLGVYRTYVRSGAPLHPDDRARISAAVEAARLDRPDIDRRLFDFLGDILMLRVNGPLEAELAMRVQQFTGPVMAKSIEDTAFYRYNRMVALNEVGGDPGRFAIPLEEFHRRMAEAQERWPLAMLATSTHDAKRSEDVRARLWLLAEIPAQWSAAVRGWAEMNRPWWRGGLADANAEYLFYQTLVGAWPLEFERAREYMLKAAREAKVHTAWHHPNPEYERSLNGFIEGAYGNAEFIADLERFVAPLVWPGRINSLAQTLIKLAAPGVPDFYQGCELWNLTLVDPDNRRPVDYGARRRLLEAARRATAEEALARCDEGLPKIWLIRKALELRRNRPELFGPAGAYQPLSARGERAAHAIAFMRGGGAIVIAPRWPLRLDNRWEGTEIDLPDGRWRDVLTGATNRGGATPVATLLARFPVALLEREAHGA